MENIFKNAWLWLKQKFWKNELRVYLTIAALPGLVYTGIKDSVLPFLTIAVLLVAHYVRPLKKKDEEDN